MKFRRAISEVSYLVFNHALKYCVEASNIYYSVKYIHETSLKSFTSQPLILTNKTD